MGKEWLYDLEKILDDDLMDYNGYGIYVMGIIVGKLEG